MATVTDAATGTTRQASAGQVRRSMAPARARDRARQAAYKAGRAGEPMPFEGEDDELLDLYNQGSNERDNASSSSSSTSSQRRAPNFGRLGKTIGGADVVDEGAGLLLGLFLYALGSAFVRGGPTAVRQWLAAKFVNSGASSDAPKTPNSDSQLMPAPGAGPTGTYPGSGGQSPTAPPSSEGYGSRVPVPGGQLNVPPPAPPGWVNPYGQPQPNADQHIGGWSS